MVAWEATALPLGDTRIAERYFTTLVVKYSAFESAIGGLNLAQILALNFLDGFVRSIFTKLFSVNLAMI